MKILVINAGSSSMKFQLFDMTNETVIAKGNIEKIGEGGSFLKYNAHDQKYKFDKEIGNHNEAMAFVIETLTNPEYGVIKSLDEINAFGHRVVNVGDKYFDSCIVTKAILADFKTKVDFSPLHVPGAIAGIEACMKICPNIPNVTVFDIGFHKTLKPYVYKYAIPRRYYDEYKIRRYGAHGTSHLFVSRVCAELMHKDVKDLKIISCHLGSGASITAIDHGESVETSMGFTPLEGIMMNTRSGDIDPAVLEFICNKEHKTISQVLTMLNKESGLLGANGIVADMREITANISNPFIKESYDMYCHRIIKYIGSYIAVMNGVDAIIFTAGVGEHTPELRRDVIKNFSYLGIKIDDKTNFEAPRDEIADITGKDSKVKVYVIPTNEEKVIAEETLKLIKN